MESLTYNLKKYLRFVVKKPTILTQVATLKARKNQAFLKTLVFDLKSTLLRPQNLTLLNYNQKNNLFKIASKEVGFYDYFEKFVFWKRCATATAVSLSVFYIFVQSQFFHLRVLANSKEF